MLHGRPLSTSTPRLPGFPEESPWPAKPFEPAVIPDPSTLLEPFQEGNTKLGDLIARASGLATTTVKVARFASWWPMNGATSCRPRR
jgi:hypothetical protein